jgi:hypothetical protein
MTVTLILCDGLFALICLFWGTFYPKKCLTTSGVCGILFRRLKNAGVAQLVEQLICNQQVGGSSPSTSSIFLEIKYGSVPEWPKGTDCKSAAFSFGGSNPPAPTRKDLFRISKQVFFYNYLIKT